MNHNKKNQMRFMLRNQFILDRTNRHSISKLHKTLENIYLVKLAKGCKSNNSVSQLFN